MADSFHSMWLEVALAGVATAVVSNALLSWAQCPAQCAPTLAALALLRSASVSIDRTRGEVRVERRHLGIPYAATSVPLEIVTGFAIEKSHEGRGATEHLVAATTEGPVRIQSGDRTQTAAITLAKALATS